LVEDKLQDLNTKLTTAKAERLRLEAELQQIDAVGDNVEALLAFPSIASAPTVADRRKDVAQVQAAVAALSQRYKEKHPKMLAARAALAEAQENLRRAVLGQPAVLRNTLEQARAAENNLASAVQEQEKSAIALNRAAIGYQELARQAETDRALYESVLRQIKETDLSKDVKTNAVSIIEHSPFPRKPVSPSPIKAIGLGLLLGLLAGAAFVYLTDAMDRSVKTVDEAEALFEMPVLAAIPEVKKSEVAPDGDGEKMQEEATYRLVAEAPEGPAAEAFRNLRAAVALLGPEIDHKVFIFTSASPAEGKSFTSANYALSLAQQGYNVLLIDGDLRRPTLHRIFQAGGAEDAKAIASGYGIVDCLVGAVDLDEAVKPVSSTRIDPVPALNGSGPSSDATQKGKLSLLAGGRRAPNPAELLSGSTFGRLIEEATRSYDRVVIDSAPVLAVSDTLLMVPHVQNVCMVIRAGHSARNAIQRALRLLSTSGGRTVGMVLNRLPRQRGASYYYYYASEGYGAGEGSYSNHYRPRVVEKGKRPVRSRTKSETLKS
jgi:Mrp family chromosome partitioning ATPase